MYSVAKTGKLATPVKDTHGSKSRIHSCLENSNPNVSYSIPGPKSTKSPLTKSAKSLKSASRNPNPAPYSPRNKIRERKFVVAKRNSKNAKAEENSAVDCKDKERFGSDMKKCISVAYKTLRASQEDFFKNRNGAEENGEVMSDSGKDSERAGNEVEEVTEKELFAQSYEIDSGYGFDNPDPSSEVEQSSQTGSSKIKRRRDKLLEEARSSVPEFGKVLHLVKAFEKLLSIPKSEESDEKKEEKEPEDDRKKPIKWALPGLQPPPKVSETQVSSSSFCPSEIILTSENLGLGSPPSVSSSWDNSRGSISSRSSSGGQRSRRNSSESCGTMGGRRWKKNQLRATSQKPFKLRTEQRGRMKEEGFMKKLQEMMIEQERQRIPIAQGLPWTTDEPESLIKPQVKECTRPVDLKLHSDIRAEERSEFDQQVAEKMNLIERYKMERERQQKLAEEEEIRRLRKELVPKAQPMPYFDRPFAPRRSLKHPTIPRDPKFHIPQHKRMKCCPSWSDLSTFTFEQ
ncbi:caldesmon isoform X1 [Tripterygium wilfordii]|uniref:Caldesmon isoform X1 n=1 Tax=Tripterygium wilfordii TaxID=458696 RepID=A0A7J7BU13_TRIWF|nr:protein WVD2-like 4 [Tripterygium wilfordii]KAF5725398.1 caldesmon isoform X1 [Tripterygium wilfordii]